MIVNSKSFCVADSISETPSYDTVQCTENVGMKLDSTSLISQSGVHRLVTIAPNPSNDVKAPFPAIVASRKILPAE